MPNILAAKFHAEDGSAIKITTDTEEIIGPVGQALLYAGLQEWLGAGGVIAPYYTILSAVYTNGEGTAVMAQTAEAGRVLCSPNKADRWAALEKWTAAGNAIGPFVPPAPPPAAPDPAAQVAALRQLMIDKSVATAAEIDAALAAAGKDSDTSSEMTPELEAAVDDSARAAHGQTD
jgi:hypothetical protein